MNSLHSFKCGLYRVLKKTGNECDIIKSASFQGAIDAFKDACTKLKQSGKDYIKSHDEIMVEGCLPIKLDKKYFG